MLSKRSLALILSLCSLSATLAQWGPPPPDQGWGGAPPKGGPGGSGPGQSQQPDPNKMFECLNSLGKISSALGMIGQSIDDGNYSPSILTNLTSTRTDLEFFLTSCASSFLAGGLGPAQGGSQAPTFTNCEDYLAKVDSLIKDIRSTWILNSQGALQDIKQLLAIIPQGPVLCANMQPPGDRLLMESDSGKDSYVREAVCLEMYGDAIPKISQAFKNVESNDEPSITVSVLKGLLSELLPMLKECDEKSYDYVHRVLLMLNVTTCLDQVIVMVPQIKQFLSELQSQTETIRDVLVDLHDEVFTSADKFLKECNVDGIFDGVSSVEVMIQRNGCADELYEIGKYGQNMVQYAGDAIYQMEAASQMVMHMDLAYGYCLAK